MVGGAVRQLDGTTVLVADGDDGDRVLVATLLESIGCGVRTVDNGLEGLTVAQSIRPDAAIVAVELPGMSGYELCHELRALAGEGLPLILVSATRTDSIDRIAGFLIGADEYLAKPFDPDELLIRVRSLLRRRVGPRPQPSQPPLAAVRFDLLTPREREVLVLLALGWNQDAIARELVVTPKTVATHIQRVLTKLGVHSRAQAVAEAHRLGLVPSETDRSTRVGGVAAPHVVIA